MNKQDLSIESLQEAASLPHILVVDDDERLRSLLFRYLSENGFLVTTAVDAKDAQEKLSVLAFDMLIVDVMMPGEDGLSLTRRLKQDSSVPILLLTALGDTSERISGLEAGADDYLAKPFEPRELLLRLNAVLRRVESNKKTSSVIRLGRWSFDTEKSDLSDGQARISLTTVEATLLRALSSKAGKTVSRDDLAEMCGLSANERTIDVQVTRLRKKVEEDPKSPKYIQTVRGKGYVLWSD